VSPRFTTTRAYDPTGGVFPSAIKGLLIANGIVFVLQIVLAGPFASLLGIRFIDVFGLRPEWVILRGWVWQPITYMFLHGGLFHLLFNMFVLWMFGAEIERIWGSRGFLRYYLVCGLGAAGLSFLFNFGSVLIGASGAVYGVLLAFGLLFPNRYIYLWFFIPVRAKYLVAGLAAIEFLAGISGPADGIGHAAHLGGMVTGWVYLKWGRGGGSPVERLMSRFRKRRFEVIDGGRSAKKAEPDASGHAAGPAREAEIDRILDKISRQGLDSLSPEEERILDEASRRPRRD